MSGEAGLLTSRNGAIYPYILWGQGMKFTRVLAVSVIAVSMGLITAEAKTLREAEIPAEYPPASYTGKQYVDSRGCVYIRAGIDGMTNWVPRVTRDRGVLCGYQPSLAKSATPPVQAPAKPVPVIEPKPAPKPAVKPVAKPVQVVTQAPKAAPVRVAPKAAPVKAKPVAPTPRPARKVVQVTPAQPVQPAAVKPVVKAAPTPVSGNARRLAPPTKVTSCEGVTGISRYYAGVSTDGMPVRCGPQSDPHVTVIRREPVTVMRGGEPVRVQRRVVHQSPAAPAPIGGQVRVAPRHVWEQQQASKVESPIPDGYRPVWKDDRLNEQRGHQTFDGIYASGLAWTRTVPRKLYVRSTGLVVTHKYPGLMYPYHSYDEMRAAGYDAAISDTAMAPQTAQKVVRRSAPKKAIVATKSVKRTAPAAPAKGRFVQVGTFGVEANAQRTASRLKSMGMPARLGRLTKGGKTYRIVLAGPFAPNQLGAALNKARSAGFSDAFVR